MGYGEGVIASSFGGRRWGQQILGGHITRLAPPRRRYTGLVGIVGVGRSFWGYNKRQGGSRMDTKGQMQYTPALQTKLGGECVSTPDGQGYSEGGVGSPWGMTRSKASIP
eukprot:752908-Hanusia_phi.AAC.4